MCESTVSAVSSMSFIVKPMPARRHKAVSLPGESPAAFDRWPLAPP